MSKQDKILKHLQSKRPITGSIAWAKYKLYRLSSVINRLRNKGYNIETEIVNKGKDMFAKYSLK